MFEIVILDFLCIFVVQGRVKFNLRKCSICFHIFSFLMRYYAVLHNICTFHYYFFSITSTSSLYKSHKKSPSSFTHLFWVVLIFKFGETNIFRKRYFYSFFAIILLDLKIFIFISILFIPYLPYSDKSDHYVN